TILLISKEEFFCVTSLKKSVLLSPIKNDISIIIRQKDNSNGKQIQEQIKKMSNTFSILDKENIKGDFSEYYMDNLNFIDSS
ncbi:hypothetical protein H311_05305, partial [Anncaliia algerae PRA109]